MRRNDRLDHDRSNVIGQLAMVPISSRTPTSCGPGPSASSSSYPGELPLAVLHTIGDTNINFQ